MENKIENALIAMGIPANIAGFDYIREAVLIVDKERMNIRWTGIYEQIGKKYGKRAYQVERSIRHAFNVARSEKGVYDVVNHYIGFAATNNASSISLLYRTIKREMGEEQGDSDIKCNNDQPIISEERVREIVRQTVKEMLGGIA